MSIQKETVVSPINIVMAFELFCACGVLIFEKKVNNKRGQENGKANGINY